MDALGGVVCGDGRRLVLLNRESVGVGVCGCVVWRGRPGRLAASKSTSISSSSEAEA